jgi:hypothetical protein
MHVNEDSRIPFAELADGRKKGVNGKLVDAQRELAAVEAFQLGKAFLHFVAEVDETFGIIFQECASVSEADGTGTADEHRLAEVLLEFADSETDGGLRAVEALGRAREAAFAGDGQEDLEFG